ncbi:MFS transporter [Mycolicibacterium chlorophenolicum]|uniref:MFS transporter n=1 Tax=Mycolicibacterium chlorophenolicum TaxID=37916 RepID=UPI001F3A4B5F|nr:MFS transporter [Mycolicibacterium chlorophenolicum]
MGNRQWWVLTAAAVASFLVLLDDTAVAIALPSMGRQLGLGLSGLEWVINIYTLPLAVLTLVAGLLTDRLGARPVFLGGVAAFTVISVLAGFSTTGAMLLGMRAAQGGAAALIAPSALTLLITSFSGSRRGVALGVWSGVAAAALAVGPLLGALLTDAFGWRSIFLLNLPFGLLMFILARAALPGPLPALRAPRPRVDVVGVVASGVTLFALVLGLAQANASGWASPRLWTMLAVAAAGAAVFVVAERRSTAPLVDLSLFRLPNVAGANVLALLNLAVMCSVFFFLSLYLQLVIGFSPTRAGLVLLPMTVLIAVFAPLAGWLVSHVGARVLIGTGMVLAAVGLVLLAGVHPSWGLWQLLPGLLVEGLGLGLATTPITTAAMLQVPDERSGIASATLNVFRMVGLSLGVAVMGAVVAAHWPGDLARSTVDAAAFTTGIAMGFWVNAVLAVLAAVLAVVAIRAPRVAPSTDLPTSR